MYACPCNNKTSFLYGNVFDSLNVILKTLIKFITHKMTVSPYIKELKLLLRTESHL